MSTSGFINVLKPAGMTSHDVVSFIRRTYGLKKVGHAGTLDPAAAGVYSRGGKPYRRGHRRGLPGAAHSHSKAGR